MENIKKNEAKTLELIEQINDEAIQASENALSEDGPYGEYLLTFGYGEAGLDQLMESWNIENDTSVLIRLYRRAYGDTQTKDLLLRHSEFTQGTIYIQSGEIFSTSLGEIEHQLSDELEGAFLSLTSEERQEVMNGVDEGHLAENGFLYLDHSYDRLLLILDEESVKEEILSE